MFDADFVEIIAGFRLWRLGLFAMRQSVQYTRQPVLPPVNQAQRSVSQVLKVLVLMLLCTFNTCLQIVILGYYAVSHLKGGFTNYLCIDIWLPLRP